MSGHVECVCESCGFETWSDRDPCSNCHTCPPVKNWGGSFRFEKALEGMRLGKRMRRAGDDRTWSIEDGKLMYSWPNSFGCGAVPAFCELAEADVMAEDWEVAA